MVPPFNKMTAMPIYGQKNKKHLKNLPQNQESFKAKS